MRKIKAIKVNTKQQIKLDQRMQEPMCPNEAETMAKVQKGTFPSPFVGHFI
jgi:hypothetical protein